MEVRELMHVEFNLEESIIINTWADNCDQDLSDFLYQAGLIGDYNEEIDGLYFEEINEETTLTALSVIEAIINRGKERE